MSHGRKLLLTLPLGYIDTRSSICGQTTHHTRLLETVRTDKDNVALRCPLGDHTVGCLLYCVALLWFCSC